MARILMVLRPDEGGAFRHVADLSRGVSAAGHEVAVCGPLERRASDLGVEVIAVPMAREIAPRADLRSVAGLVRAIRSFRPDIVHAQGTKASVYARVGRAAHPRLPVLYTPHGYPFNGYFEGEATRRRYRRIERLLSPLATRVICVCEAERKLAESVGPASRTRVVYNGTEADPSASVHPAIAELGDRPVVAALSGLRPGKGIETLIEAWPAVVSGHPSAMLVIAGDGPKRELIEELVGRLGVSASVRLIGHSPAGEVLAGTTLFVNASWAESFPYAVLEAMAFGRPIVATDVGGTREAIVDDVSGKLVAPRDPAALAGSIAALLGDPRAAGALGTAASARHRERFTIERMVERTLEVYSEVR